jgi:hypothetical protein
VLCYLAFYFLSFLEIGHVDWIGVDWIGCCAVSYLGQQQRLAGAEGSCRLVLWRVRFFSLSLSLFGILLLGRYCVYVCIHLSLVSSRDALLPPSLPPSLCRRRHRRCRCHATPSNSTSYTSCIASHQHQRQPPSATSLDESSTHNTITMTTTLPFAMATTAGGRRRVG